MSLLKTYISNEMIMIHYFLALNPALLVLSEVRSKLLLLITDILT